MENQPTSDGMWQVQLQNKFSLLSSAEASPSVQSRSDPEQSKSIKGSVSKNNEPDSAKSIRVASLNINRGLIKKENELKYTIQENNIDIKCSSNNWRSGHSVLCFATLELLDFPSTRDVDEIRCHMLFQHALYVS